MPNPEKIKLLSFNILKDRGVIDTNKTSFTSFSKKMSDPEFANKVYNLFTDYGIIDTNKTSDIDFEKSVIPEMYDKIEDKKRIADYALNVPGVLIEQAKYVWDSIIPSAKILGDQISQSELEYDKSLSSKEDKTKLNSFISKLENEQKNVIEDMYFKQQQSYKDFRDPESDKWYGGLIDPTHENIITRSIGQVGQIAASASLMLVPGIGIGLSAFSAMTMEGLSMASDDYGASMKRDENGNPIPGTGDVKAAKVSFGIGLALGATDIITPMMAVESMLGKKLIFKGTETLTEMATPKGFFKTLSKIIGSEVLQETGQDTGEQLTSMMHGYQDNFDFARTYDVALTTALSTLYFGLGTQTISHRQIKKQLKILKEILPKKLEAENAIGIVSDEKKEELLKKLNEAIEKPELINEKIKEYNDILDNVLDSQITKEIKKSKEFQSIRKKVTKTLKNNKIELSDKEIDRQTYIQYVISKIAEEQFKLFAIKKEANTIKDNIIENVNTNKTNIIESLADIFDTEEINDIKKEVAKTDEFKDELKNVKGKTLKERKEKLHNELFKNNVELYSDAIERRLTNKLFKNTKELEFTEQFLEDDNELIPFDDFQETISEKSDLVEEIEKDIKDIPSSKNEVINKSIERIKSKLNNDETKSIVNLLNELSFIEKQKDITPELSKQIKTIKDKLEQKGYKVSYPYKNNDIIENGVKKVAFTIKPQIKYNDEVIQRQNIATEINEKRYSTKLKKELALELKERNLKVSGTKQELINRLMEDDAINSTNNVLNEDINIDDILDNIFSDKPLKDNKTTRKYKYPDFVRNDPILVKLSRELNNLRANKHKIPDVPLFFLRKGINPNDLVFRINEKAREELGYPLIYWSPGIQAIGILPNDKRVPENNVLRDKSPVLNTKHIIEAEISPEEAIQLKKYIPYISLETYNLPQKASDVVFHGTQSQKIQLDSQGNLILNPSENFSGKTNSISFTLYRDVAKFYGEHRDGKNRGVVANTVIIAIKKAALPKKIVRESFEELAISTTKPIIISKNNFVIHKAIKSNSVEQDFKKWETKIETKVKQESNDKLVIEDINGSNSQEIIENEGIDIRPVEKGSVSELIQDRYGVEPEITLRSQIARQEIINRIQLMGYDNFIKSLSDQIVSSVYGNVSLKEWVKNEYKEITDRQIPKNNILREESNQSSNILLKKGQQFTWAQYSDNNYEVSSVGDKRFSAMYAQLKDGRIIEDIYQLDIKGKGTAKPQPKGSKSKVGKKGKGTLYSYEEQYKKYKDLWKQYFNENPGLLEDLRQKAKGKVLTDKFATTEISQARVMAELLNETIENTSNQILAKKIEEQINDLIKKAKKDLAEANTVPNENFIIGFHGGQNFTVPNKNFLYTGEFRDEEVKRIAESMGARYENMMLFYTEDKENNVSYEKAAKYAFRYAINYGNNNPTLYAFIINKKDADFGDRGIAEVGVNYDNIQNSIREIGRVSFKRNIPNQTSITDKEYKTELASYIYSKKNIINYESMEEYAKQGIDRYDKKLKEEKSFYEESLANIKILETEFPEFKEIYSNIITKKYSINSFFKEQISERYIRLNNFRNLINNENNSKKIQQIIKEKKNWANKVKDKSLKSIIELEKKLAENRLEKLNLDKTNQTSTEANTPMQKALSVETERNVSDYIETPSTIPETSQNKEEINSIEEATTIKELVDILDEHLNIDETSSVYQYGNWLIEKLSGVKIRFADREEIISGNTTLGSSRAAYIIDQNSIVFNKDIIKENNVFFRTILHEATHALTARTLNPNDALYDLQFRKDLENLYDSMMKELEPEFIDKYSDEIAKISYDENLTGERLRNAKTKALQEFIAYIMSNTGTSEGSNIREWMKTHEIKSNMSYFAEFVNKIKKLLKKLLGKVTYFDGVEFILAETFGYKYNVTDLIKETVTEEEKFDLDEKYDIVSTILAKQTEPINLQNIVTLLSPNHENDWYDYITSIPFEEFRKNILKSKQFLQSIDNYYTVKEMYEDKEQFTEYLVIRLYNLANSVEKFPVYRTQFKMGYDKVKKKKVITDVKLELLPDNYYDKNNNTQNSYRYKIMLSKRLDEINKILGMDFEIIHLDEVKKYRKNGITWHKINSNDLDFSKRNNTYAKLFRDNGIYFLGTYSDKSTVIALKSKTGKKLSKSIINKIEKFYKEKIQKLVEANVIDKNELEKYLKEDDLYEYNKPSYVLRLLLEDLRLGGKFEKDNLQSRLFNPEESASYDLLKIFKRPIDVMPLYSSLFTPERNKVLYDNLKDKTGIVLDKNNNLHFNFVVVKSDTELEFPITFNGEEKTINLKDLLINELGTSIFDGVNIYADNWGEIIENTTGKVKGGVKKGKIINSPNTPNLFNKGAFFKTNSVVIKDWMKKNKISLIMFDEAVKYSDYEHNDLLGKPNVQTIPFSEYYHDNEKGVANSDGKGLGQMVTSFFNTEYNPLYVEKSKDTIEKISEKFLDDFKRELFDIEPRKVLEEIKKLSLESLNSKKNTIAAILTDYLYKISADNVVQKLNDELISKEIENAFLEPYIASILKDYIKKHLNKIFDYQIPSTWLTLRPDFGWLEVDNIKQVYKNVVEKHNSLKEFIELNNKDLINKNRKIEENVKLLDNIINKIKILTDKKETESILKALVGLEDRKKELTNYIDKLNNEYDKLESDIKEKEKEYKKNIEKEFNEIIDIKTGRLKNGWVYVSNDINKVIKNGKKIYNVKFNDPIISTIIPGSDLGSQTSVKVAAFIENADNGIATLNSEYIQTTQGKDYDIDQVLLTPFTDKFFTEETYNSFANSALESSKNYRKEIKKVYSRVLGRNLSEAEVYSEDVQIEFMQKFSNATSGQKLFNPLTQSMDMLDKFTKNIGFILNFNKIITVQAQLGFNTKVRLFNKSYTLNPRKNLAVTSIVFSRLLHDTVDKPTNINSFFYELKMIDLISIAYGINLAKDMHKKGIVYRENINDAKNPNEVQLHLFVKDLTKLNKTFFSFGTKISASYNLTDMDKKRELEDILQYISVQRTINDYMLNNQKKQLKKYAQLKNKDVVSKVMEEWINNISIKNIDKSEIFNFINQIPLEAIPELNVNKNTYIEWQRELARNYLNEPKLKENLLNAVENNTKFLTQFRKSDVIGIQLGFNINTEENEYLMKLFLTTRPEGRNTSLHLLKAKIITLLNPIPQRLKKTSSANIEYYYNDIFQEANDYSYPKLFKLLLEKRALHYNKNVSWIMLETPNKHKILLFPNGDGSLIFKVQWKKKTYSWSSNELLNDKSKLGQMVLNNLIGDQSLFSNKSFSENSYMGSNNRFELSKLLRFSGNIDYKGRINFAVDLLNKELNSYTDIDKEIFWTSLLGYPKGNLLYPLNTIITKELADNKFFSQDKLLEIASKVKDESGLKFVSKYIRYASKTYRGLGFKNKILIKNNIEESGLNVSNNILFEEEPIELNKETVPYIKKFNTIFDVISKNPESKKISDEGIIGEFPDLLNGKIKPITKLDVTRITQSAYATNIPAKLVSLEELYVTKRLKTTHIFQSYINRYDTLYGEINTNADKYYKNNPNTLKKEIMKKINLLSENFPYKVTFKETLKGEFLVKDDKMKDFTNINQFLTIKRITNVDKRLLYKSVLNLRIIYDYLNTKLALNTLDYMKHIYADLPNNFANADIVKNYLDRWRKLIKQLEGKKGKYFPRTYEEDVANEIALELSGINTLRIENPKLTYKQAYDLYNERKTDIEFMKKVEKNKIIVDGYNGIVHSWQLKRIFPDFLVKERYITESFDMHKKHRTEFFNAVLEDLATIDYLLYEHESAINNTPQKLRNSMKNWYALFTKSRFVQSKKVKFNKAKKGSALVFHYIGENGKSKSIKGVLLNETNEYVELSLNKEEYKRLLESNLEKTEEFFSKIIDKEYLKKIPVSEAQMKLLDYWDIPSEGLSVYDVPEKIIAKIENLLNNEDQWGKYYKDNIFIRQYVNSEPITFKGYEIRWESIKLPNINTKYLKSPKTVDSYLSSIQKIGSLLMLGNPGAGARNFMESMYRTILAVGARYFVSIDKNNTSKLIPGWLKKKEDNLFKEAMQFKNKFKDEVANSNLSSHSLRIAKLSKLESIKNISPFTDNEETLSKIKIVESLVTRYLLRNALGNNEEIGASFVGELDDKKISAFLLSYFRKAEHTNRIVGAYLFAYKAIFIDGITNIETINSVIEKGVERANSIYDMEHRQLVEEKAGGNLLTQFAQFNVNQRNFRRWELQQGKRLGQIKPVWNEVKHGNIGEAWLNGKFNLKSIFMEEMTVKDENGKKRTYRAGDSVDPIILRNIAKEFLFDLLIGMPAQLVLPGLRWGNPVNIATIMGFKIILEAILYGDTPDEWDLSQFFFTLVSFWVGMGITVPIQLVWSIIAEREKINPVNPKLSTIAIDGARYLLSDNKSPQQEVAGSNYLTGQVVSALTSINPMSYTSHKQSRFKNKISSAPFYERPPIILNESVKKLFEILQ